MFNNFFNKNEKLVNNNSSIEEGNNIENLKHGLSKKISVIKETIQGMSSEQLADAAKSGAFAALSMSASFCAAMIATDPHMTLGFEERIAGAGILNIFAGMFYAESLQYGRELAPSLEKVSE